jgi:FKBP-type peptidyl-prolyl cis-trans isomerase
MKIRNLLLVLIISAPIIACNPFNKKNAIKTQVDSISYVMGASDGERLIAQFEQSKLDSLLNLDNYFKALLDAAHQKELKMNPDSNMASIQSFFREFQMNQMAAMRDSTGKTPKFNPSKERIDSISYLMGASDGKGISEGFKKAGMDTVVVFELYLEGLTTSAKKGEVRVPVKENIEMVQKFFTDLQEKRMTAEFGPNKKAGEEFLAKNKANADVTTTASGLQYMVITEGKGPKPTYNDKVKVQYTGTLLDGTVFDSSVQRGEPATFGVGQVIPGWTEALQLMPVGSKWKIFVPQELAYGTRVRPGGPIKPYSMLIFEVELLEIVK